MGALSVDFIALKKQVSVHFALDHFTSPELAQLGRYYSANTLMNAHMF